MWRAVGNVAHGRVIRIVKEVLLNHTHSLYRRLLLKSPSPPRYPLLYQWARINVDGAKVCTSGHGAAMARKDLVVRIKTCLDDDLL